MSVNLGSRFSILDGKREVTVPNVTEGDDYRIVCKRGHLSHLMGASLTVLISVWRLWQLERNVLHRPRYIDSHPLPILDLTITLLLLLQLQQTPNTAATSSKPTTTELQD